MSEFVRATSANLPKIDSFMVFAYFKSNPNFQQPEIRNVKTGRAAVVETYGDDAVGYVELKRCSAKCHVKGRVTPQQRVRAKPYHVEVVVDAGAESIESVQCFDCAACAGGCKHAVAFLFWLHRLIGNRIANIKVIK